jgi:beta-mannosidase
MKRIDLAGTWQLKQVGTTDLIDAPVPGDVHSALLAAGKIPDPYFGRNELDVQWVGRTNWTYSREFEVPAEFLAEKHVYLNADWLDTVAQVSINGKRVLKAENSFRRWRVPVTNLKAGTNTVELAFSSPVREAAKRAKKHHDEMGYDVPTSDFPPVSEPHRNMLRKPACHSGWDWGVCLTAMGIYGDISLGATSEGRIEYVHLDSERRGEQWRVTVRVEVRPAVSGRYPVEVTLGDQNLCEEFDMVAEGDHAGVYSLTFMVDNPRLWWPNGYGEQELYDLTVRAVGQEVHQRIGLRTLELVTKEDADGEGSSFYLKVNGVPVFAKGANWIPCDALPARQTREVYDDLLSSAVDANMNMLRVWGGGQYEHEAFYELCDEKGLLVWHDFMFSCSLYPADEGYLGQVEQEAHHQIKRLRHHPCIALWCGNNENVGALTWFEESRKSRDRYLIDYFKLNDQILGGAVHRYDGARTFWPSSPSAGFGDYSDNWHDDRRGDMHYWSVWHEGKSFDAFYDVKPRFCSEFGYQSFPSMETIRTYAPEDQLNVTSPVMEHHQRNTGGNSRIVEMFTRYFRVPEGFANFVYLSQVQQALAIKTAVEHWRHLQPTCMGTLYWQLNDNWPVCSWASLEYGGKWKLLHYMARRFYAATIASAFQTRDGRLELWVTNDDPRPKACTLTAQLMGFDGVAGREMSWKVKAPAGGAKLVYTALAADLAPHLETCFLVLRLEMDGQVITNEHFFTEYKHCELPAAKVQAKVVKEGAGLAVDLSTDAPAFYVSLDAEGLPGRFEDNCFTLLPGEPRRVAFLPKGKVSVAALKDALTVNHLRATYR